MSAKIPLRLQAVLDEDEEVKRPPKYTEEELKEMKKSDKKKKKIEDERLKPKMNLMFKYGDDLRRDNLVLQFFKLMDKLWLQNDKDLQMVAYNVLETGYQIGYIEFVDNAIEIEKIHKRKLCGRGPLSKLSIYDYISYCLVEPPDPKDQLIHLNQLDQYYDAFRKSLAGQCVATYVLAIKDRHSGNIMLEKPTGRIFHIDFGHFMGDAKMKCGILRDREPFIYSPEMHFIITDFPAYIRRRKEEMKGEESQNEEDRTGERDEDDSLRADSERELNPEAPEQPRKKRCCDSGNYQVNTKRNFEEFEKICC